MILPCPWCGLLLDLGEGSLIMTYQCPRGGKQSTAKVLKTDPTDAEGSAPEGVAAFVRTPPPLACFMYELLRGPWGSKNFYVMPCVGDGGIPLAWLRHGRHIEGGVFCELFPNSLDNLVTALCEQQWELSEECDQAEWQERLACGARVGGHLEARNAATKQRVGLQKKTTKTPEDNPKRVELTWHRP